MKLFVSGVFALGLLSVATVSHAQSVDYAAIALRMQAIISEMQSLQKEFAGLQAAVLPSSSSTTGSAGSTPVFGLVLGAMTTDLQKTVVYGQTNNTISKVQTLLATDPEIYLDGTVSGFFGPKTEAAIKALQSRFGMNQVGMVGPETAALLAEYFATYPDEKYPAGALKTRPAKTGSVLGASITTPVVSSPVTTQSVSAGTPLEAIYLKKDSGEIVARVVYKDGRGVGVVSESSNEDDIVRAITRKTGLSSAQVSAVLDMSQLKPSRSSRDYSESDAEDALLDAEDAIDSARDDIEDADDDGADVNEAEDLLDDAEDALADAEDAFDDEDYDEAYDLAKEARSLARDAVRAIED